MLPSPTGRETRARRRCWGLQLGGPHGWGVFAACYSSTFFQVLFSDYAPICIKESRFRFIKD